MKPQENHIDTAGCDCRLITDEEIISDVSEIIRKTGGEKEKVIRILQEVQNHFNYIPSEALRYICKVTEIGPGQLSGVSTFYSQFRHLPVGEHIIKICTGTACHVKGSAFVSDSFKRVLQITDERNSSPDNLFSIEEVACLGCCTLAPVVQIDGKTYGHVKPTQAAEILKDFLNSKDPDIRPESQDQNEDVDAEVRIGLGSCCVAGGSKEVLAELLEVKNRWHLNIRIKPVGCVGICNQTPLLEIVKSNDEHSRYTNVRKEKVEEIILNHVKPVSVNGRVKRSLFDLADTYRSDRKLYSPVNLKSDVREKYINNFLQFQTHIATDYSGILSPDSYQEYISLDGFKALRHCLFDLLPEGVIEIIKTSTLRGRGGAGFTTGEKWDLSGKAVSGTKYVVCNGDEGDPGAFMDRMLLESFPFRIIEGMLIAGFATGASNGILYIRAEYPLAVKRINRAITLCYENGLLGNNVAGSGYSFNLTIFEGAGAFVCGEETALIASLEGKRGTPHLRPPYPSEQGFKGYPTLVNNVETFSIVPWIINHGAEVFRNIGTEKSKGTKVFALAGKIAKGGLIEVPMGITIREIVEKIGNGVGPGRKFKAVQIGGPSGGCIPERLADTAVDYEELSQLGAMMGSGGMVVLDDTDCMVDIAKYFLLFSHKQSCGKCTFCRIGTKHMLNILTKLSKGLASLSDLSELETLCNSVKNGSLCGLGKTAPNPVLTGLRFFREEYEAHTRGICPSGKCSDLIKYIINENCTGCTKCSQECPVNAIPFKPYEQHSIDLSVCTKCDSCRIVCPENAVQIVNINDKAEDR